MNYLSKILKAAKEEGVLAIPIRIKNHLLLRVVPYFDIKFDRKYGVDTCGIKPLSDLDINSSQKLTAVHYEPTPVDAIRSILKEIPIYHPDYTFVDFGSGKGRVLLLASEYPFGKIVGVELSQSLHGIAESNIQIWDCPEQKCFEVESLCIDASKYSLPDTPLVLFFFSPFSPSVLSCVIDRIRESLLTNPRGIHIVYYGSRQDLIELFHTLNFSHKEVYFKRPLSAIGKYKGHLFSGNT